jgi:hypothetical protein
VTRDGRVTNRRLLRRLSERASLAIAHPALTSRSLIAANLTSHASRLPLRPSFAARAAAHTTHNPLLLLSFFSEEETAGRATSLRDQ